jgi:hypothetical protein
MLLRDGLLNMSLRNRKLRRGFSGLSSFGDLEALSFTFVWNATASKLRSGLSFLVIDDHSSDPRYLG